MQGYGNQYAHLLHSEAVNQGSWKSKDLYLVKHDINRRWE